MIMRDNCSVASSSTWTLIWIRIVMVVVFSFGLILPSPALAFRDDLTEVCQWETFRAECPSDEVVVITDAVYGRMRHGRCIRSDAEHVGCQTNVRSLADARCSGRTKCQIEVPDKLFDGTQTACKEDLKSYLMASYVCLKVLLPSGSQCRNLNEAGVPTESGILASTVSASTVCGSPSSPWHIEVLQGQRINLTLVDFLMPGSPTVQVGGGDRGNSCQVIAVIKENAAKTAAGQSKTVCGRESRERERSIFLSMKNSIEVRLIVAKLAAEGGHFLIRFEAVGCPDLEPPKRGWWQRSVGGNATSGCIDDVSRRVWQQTCVGRRWVGDTPNCTEQKFLEYQSRYPWSAISRFTAVAIIVIIAVAVGLCVFFVGLFVIRNRRRDHSHLKHYRPPPSSSSKLVAATAAGATLPGDSAGSMGAGYVPRRDDAYLTVKLPAHRTHDTLQQQQPVLLSQQLRDTAYESEDNEYAYVDEFQFPSATNTTNTATGNCGQGVHPYGLLSRPACELGAECVGSSHENRTTQQEANSQGVQQWQHHHHHIGHHQQHQQQDQSYQLHPEQSYYEGRDGRANSLPRDLIRKC